MVHEQARTGRRVLIVDKDVAEAASLQEQLTVLGNEVRTAATLVQCRAAVEEFRPALAVCDVSMFTTSGQEIFKPEALGSNIPCIGMAREPSAHLVVQGFRGGICDFYNKALPIAELTSILDRSKSRCDSESQSYQTLWHAKLAAEAASRAKSEFLATVSHELRTPLNAIIGFSDLIIREIFGPIGDPRYLDYLNDIHRSGCHLLSIINDILDFTKAEASKLVVNDEDVHVGDAVNAVVRLMRPRVQENRLTLEVLLAQDLPQLRCDQRKLKQMVLNLIGNAVKFTPAGGSVSVSAQCSNSGFEISVTDSGIGISKSDLGRVLQPFVQADNKLNRSHDGTGLGLTLVRSMMEIHGGTFKLESEHGIGTTATMVFPTERILTDGQVRSAQQTAA